VQHGIASRADPRTTRRCAKAVAEAVHPAPVARAHQLAVLVHVGDVGQRFVAEPVPAEDGGAGLRVQLAVETLGERELLGIAQRLVAEHENSEAVHALADRLQVRGGVHRAQVYPGDLGRETVREADGMKLHGMASAFSPVQKITLVSRRRPQTTALIARWRNEKVCHICNRSVSSTLVTCSGRSRENKP
jgi:hypothetical protein